MISINKNKGQKLEKSWGLTSVKIIGPLTQEDLNYLRGSNVVELNLTEAKIGALGNEENEENRFVNSFYKCKNLKIIILPERLKFTKAKSPHLYPSQCTKKPINDCIIGSWAFCECTSLTSINIPSDVISIGDSAFYGCSSLNSINITNKITWIGDYAFCRCSSLKFINLPASVKSIGNGAFDNCELLTSMNIPSVIYENLPATITNLKITGELSQNNFNYLRESNITKLDLSEAKLIEIGNEWGHTDRYENSFCECRSLKSIILPEGLRSIKTRAFRDCSSLSIINIPNGVTSIGSWAFYRCFSLNSINIPNSVTSIDGSAFAGCLALSSITLDGNLHYELKDGVLYTKDEKKLVSVIRTPKRITVPDSVNEIGESACCGSSALVAIAIPKSVTVIGNRAFQGCIGLSSILLPISIEIIKDYTFCECSAITSITLPDSISWIGDFAFYKCSSLTTINIPENVTFIGDYTFYDCTSLVSISLPNSITTIGKGAFQGCRALGSITLPNITNISDEIFSGCLLLFSINIPHSVARIGNKAFIDCTSLSSIDIPINTKNIGDQAFSGCSSLVLINIPSSVSNIGDYAFFNCLSLSQINVSDDTNLGRHVFDNCPAQPYFCAMALCECGLYYPRDSAVASNDKHKNVKCECGSVVKKCCLEKHIAEHKFVRCNDCNEEVESYLMASHLSDKGCKRPLVCDHKKKGCEYTIPYGTDERTKQQLMRSHLNYICRFEKVKEKSTEYQSCPFADRGCGFNVSPELTPEKARTRVMEHLRNDCPFELLPCENKECSEFVSRKLYSSHLKTCSYSLFECQYCGQLLHNIDDHIRDRCTKIHCKNVINGCNFFSLDKTELMAHENNCNMKICQYCNNSVRNLDGHIKRTCEKTHCKNIANGCKFFTLNEEELKSHEAECRLSECILCCDFCDTGFQTEKDLKKHLLHDCTENVCGNEGCAKRCFTLDSLMDHIEGCSYK